MIIRVQRLHASETAAIPEKMPARQMHGNAPPTVIRFVQREKMAVWPGAIPSHARMIRFVMQTKRNASLKAAITPETIPAITPETIPAITPETIPAITLATIPAITLATIPAIINVRMSVISQSANVRTVRSRNALQMKTAASFGVNPRTAEATATAIPKQMNASQAVTTNAARESRNAMASSL